MLSTTEASAPVLHASQIEDLKRPSSKMTAARRCAFQAAMTLKYCRGSARQAERVFGWNRGTVKLGLQKQRTGVIGLGAQAPFCGSCLWEDPYGSSFEPSDFIVDSLFDGWKDTPEAERAPITPVQLKVDKGPESSGVRTQFLKRRVDFADHTGKIIQLLYYPPYPSQSKI